MWLARTRGGVSFSLQLQWTAYALIWIIRFVQCFSCVYLSNKIPQTRNNFIAFVIWLIYVKSTFGMIRITIKDIYLDKYIHVLHYINLILYISQYIYTIIYHIFFLTQSKNKHFCHKALQTTITNISFPEEKFQLNSNGVDSIEFLYSFGK